MSNEYNCIIVDDEPAAIEMLSDSLAIVNRKIHIMATFTSWSEALEGIRSLECDILFLDISINGRNGMDLLRMIPDIRCEVIFVTAYSDHAVDAFRFPASGYLLKPVNEVDLALTLERTLARVDQKKMVAKMQQPVLEARIGIPDSSSITYVSIQDILFLEAVSSYTKVVTRDGTIMSAYNLGKFKELLPEALFFQVHRSFMINLNRIRRYESTGYVILDNGSEVPVARSAKAALLALFARVRPGEGR